jgi:predicted secreted hydrolase
VKRPVSFDILLLIILALLCSCDAPGARFPEPGIGGSRLGVFLGKDDQSSTFSQADKPTAFVFPGEHQQHPDFRSEWWYLTATLATSDGREFGAQFTVFRQALRSANPGEIRSGDWALDQVYLGHLAITDVAVGNHQNEERLSRQHPDLAGVNPLIGGGAQVYLEGWQLDLESTGGHLLAQGSGLSLDLNLYAALEPVLQGEHGWSRKSESQASYYYSWPRLQIVGEIGIGGETHKVRGLGWFDHEWSTSVLSDEQVGWEWFALSLDDERDLMVFRLRRQDGQRDRHDHGMLVAKDGSSRLLASTDFELQPERIWTDPDGVAWPLGWRLTLGPEEFFIETPVDDQRMQTLIPYWEGLVVVRSTAGRRVGRGYMELTGY